jgi:serine phosphatase RsbU (regulator of sigma subunit)
VCNSRLRANETAKAKILDLQEFIYAVVRTFAPESRLFNSAERGHFIRDQSRIDADHAAFQGFRGSPGATDVPAEEVARQTEFGIVGHLNTFFIAPEAEKRCQRAEGLLAGDLHLGSYLAQNRRFEKCSTESVSLTAKQTAASLGDSILNMIFNLLDSGKIDQRSLEDLWIKSVANLKLSNSSNELFSEGLVNAGLNVETIRANCFMSKRPTSVDPVKVILRTSGLEVISPPISLASPVRTLNTPAGTFGISRDITEKKRAAEKLARLAEELRVKNESLEQDLEMARELQCALMPQRFPNFPHDSTEQDSAVRFYPFFRPSMILSGDFFDVLDIANDKVGLFICDVMGHGVRAALVAAIVRSVVSELRLLWTKPGDLLVAINRALLGAFKNSDITLFATAFYVVADLSKGHLRYANAGHPHPLHLTRSANGSTATASPLMGVRSGPALGLFDGAKYETARHKLSSRDVVLLFTDGFFEVEGSGGHLCDYDQLSRAIGDRTELPVAELCRGLVDEVQQFSAPQEFNDDVCLVAMDIDRFKPL